MEVLTPRTLREALFTSAGRPDALVVQGGTDVLVDLNFGRVKPRAVLNLAEIDELRGWRPIPEGVRLGSAVTFAELAAPPLSKLLPALGEAARTVGSPQIRNRATVGGNLATGSPAGDSLPALAIAGAELELASATARRTLALEAFLQGPRHTALEPGELIVAVRVPVSRMRQTFMKVGPRNSMTIAVASLALTADRDRGCIRAACGSVGPVVRAVETPIEESDRLPDRLAAVASPIDDVRGTAAYRRHAVRVLAVRALERCL